MKSKFFPSLLRAVLLCAIILGLGIAQASAATFVVTNKTDITTADGVCDVAGTGDGCNLREAITASNNAGGTNTITFSPDVSGRLMLKSTLLPTITNDLTIVGPNASALIIFAPPATQNRVFSIGNCTAVISGLTIINQSTGLSVANSTGIYNNGHLTINNCYITGNKGPIGAGIYNDSNGVLEISNSAISSNEANIDGGGIYNAGSITLNNCTVGGNLARNGNGDGGGIKNDGTLTMDSCTVYGNQAKRGGGLFNTGTFSLNNTIVSTNSATQTATAIYGPISAGDYNLVNGTYTDTLPGTHNIIGQDPKVQWTDIDLIPSYALQADSPAINVGSTSLPTDQRGYTRPVGGIADIGACEYIAPPTGPNFIVNTNDDHDDGACSISDCSLREAINASNADNDPGTTDVITFADNVRGTIDLGLARDDSLSLTAFNIKENLKIEGPGAALLTIRRATGGRYRFFHIRTGVTAAMSGLTLANGSTTDESQGTIIQISGGAIYNEANLTLTGCSFNSNWAVRQGGAIMGGGTLTMQACDFSANSSAYFGGGIYIQGQATIENSTFSNNTGAVGGAIENAYYLTTINNCTFTQNSVTGTGGAIDTPTSIDVRNSTFSLNTGGPTGSGGALYMTFGNAVNFANCTFSNNSAKSGGVFLNRFGNLNIDSCTFSGNSASDSGASIYTFSSTTTTVKNNIFNDSSGGSIVNNGTLTDNGYNIAIDNGGGALTAATDKLNTDAQLGPLADNGGPTKTFAIAKGSPAINTGDTTLTTDQRGSLRPKNGADDIGAFEAVLTPELTLNLAPASAYTNDTLTVTPTSNYFDSSPTYTYDWQVNGSSVQNSASNNFDLSVAGHGDKGDVITVFVTATAGTQIVTKNTGLTIKASSPSIDVPTPPLAPTSPVGQAPVGGLPLTYRHPDGANQLRQVQVMVNYSNKLGNGLIARYDISTDKLYLLSDSGQQWMGPITPGTAATLSNSSGILRAATTTITPNAQTLTMNWGLEPNQNRLGNNTIRGYALDSSGNASPVPWTEVGHWQVKTAQVPTVDQSSPLISLNSNAGDWRTFSLTFRDGDGSADLAEYGVEINQSNTRTNATVVSYLVKTHSFRVLPDSNPNWLTTPDANGIIGNSSGAVDTTASTVTDNGDGSVTVTFKIQQSANSLGKNAIRGYAVDRSNLSSIKPNAVQGYWQVNSAPASITASKRKPTSNSVHGS